MKISYSLRDGSAAVTSIQLRLTVPHGGGRLKYGTGLSVKVRHWNGDTQRVNPSRHYPAATQLNQLLDGAAGVCLATYRRAADAGLPLTGQNLRAALDDYFGRRATGQPIPTTLYEYATYYFDRQLQRGKIKPSSHRAHVSTFSQLQQWRPLLTFDAITLDFHADLLAWLYGAPKFSSASTAGKYVKVIKTVLRAATDDGVNFNTAYQDRRFSKPSSSSDHVYLNPEELATLHALDLTATPYLDRVRDQFLMGCWTGLRFSDFTQITPAGISTLRTPAGASTDVLRLTTKKTEQTVTIPLHPTVKAILTKYGGQLPRQISNQKFNQYLREVGERAGFGHSVAVARNRGGRDVVSRRRVCDLLTSHAARRSFATNMYNAGVPVASIRAITGHTTDKSFYTYIKTDADGHAAILASSALFAPPATPHAGELDQQRAGGKGSQLGKVAG